MGIVAFNKPYYFCCWLNLVSTIMQELITYIIILACVGYTLYSFVRIFTIKEKNGCSTGCSCGPINAKGGILSKMNKPFG
jgi:hypothetical protein